MTPKKGATKCESTYTGPKGGKWKVRNTTSSIEWVAQNQAAKDECRKRIAKAIRQGGAALNHLAKKKPAKAAENKAVKKKT